MTTTTATTTATALATVSARTPAVVDFTPDWAERLLQPGADAPAGLRSWNGSDPAQRFAVHRNNVLAGLSDALAETFPVLREVVGADCFHALALAFIPQHPPRSPVLAEWGAEFGPWLDDFAAAQPELAALPWLGDLARLEWLRQRCCHAADVPALPLDALAQRLNDPDSLPAWRPGWHPAAGLWRSRWAGLSLWSAHQRVDQRADPTEPVSLAGLDIHRPEAALLMPSSGSSSGDDDAVQLWPLCAPAAAFCAALESGAPFGEAHRLALAEADAQTGAAVDVEAGSGANAANAVAPAAFDLIAMLTLLLREGVLVAAD